MEERYRAIKACFTDCFFSSSPATTLSTSTTAAASSNHKVQRAVIQLQTIVEETPVLRLYAARQLATHLLECICKQQDAKTGGFVDHHLLGSTAASLLCGLFERLLPSHGMEAEAGFQSLCRYDLDEWLRVVTLLLTVDTIVYLKA